MRKQRDLFLDLLKGIAIVLVIVGHVIQFSDTSQPDFFKNYFFKAIYLFHMPLFIFISGYVSYKIEQGGISNFIIKRWEHLILPMLAGSLLYTLIYASKNRFNNDLIEYLLFFKDYLANAFWYIYTLIYCNICSYLIHKIAKDNTLILISSVILFTFLPDSYYLSYFKFLYPFYIMGYISKKESCKVWDQQKRVVSISLLVYAACFLTWKNDFYIYNNEHVTLLSERVTSSFFRLLAGTSGIVLFSNVLFIAKKYIPIYMNNKIIKLGQITLGVYIYQTIFFSLISYINPNLHINYWLYNLIWVPIVSSILLAAIGFSINTLSKNKFLGKILFGIK